MACILIIEDNPANLELMDYLLKAFGHTPRTATDGATGTAAALARAPSLILCDLQMPGLDGYQVARVVRAQPSLQHVPLIAVTAYAMVGDRERVLAAGFDSYISKPIIPETFVSQIEAFLPPEERLAMHLTRRPAGAPDGTVACPPGAEVGAGRPVEASPRHSIAASIDQNRLSHGYNPDR